MNINTMIENEAFMMIAKHYAEKINVSGMNVCFDELQKSVKENWNQIANEIATLTETVKSII